MNGTASSTPDHVSETAQKPVVDCSDLDAIARFVSDEFGPWGKGVLVDQNMIDRFADLTDDHQWIHVDIERAQASPIGSTIAHGFLVLGLATALKGEFGFEISGYARALNYGIDGLRFATPVKPGDELRGRSRLSAVAAKPTGTLITREVELVVAGASKPAVVFQWHTLYCPARP